jgi:hypothetical protein
VGPRITGAEQKVPIVNAQTTLLFLKKGSYDKTRDGEPMRWKNGGTIDYVDAYDYEQETVVRMTISQELQGELPEAPGAGFMALIQLTEDRDRGRLKKRLLACEPRDIAIAA